MGKIRKLMAACDLSEYSRLIIERAGELSDSLSADLAIVNVINQRDVNALNKALRQNVYSGEKIELDKYIREEKEGRIHDLKNLIKSTGFNYLSPKIIILTGIPSYAILKAVEHEDSDLLVIGKKGRGNVAGMVLGSTADRIFRNCPIMLLILRIPKALTAVTDKLPLPELSYELP